MRENTGSQEVFLTNASHNHPVATWGVRPIVLGYTTWAWNFGFLIEDRLSDMHRMFEGQPGTPELFAKYHIKYVAIGSGELADFHANEAFFKEHYSMIFKDQNYRIYQVAN